VVRETKENSLPGRKAAVYLRSAISFGSPDSHCFATQKQSEDIHEYADKNSLNITAIYRDEGKGGLQIEGRTGLQSLLTDIQSGLMEYTVILLRDVSRWGRDIKISRYCETLCRSSGVEVRYTEESHDVDEHATASVTGALGRLPKEALHE
jgi:DNA invertase Pin-like site-specific DNA recombinase